MGVSFPSILHTVRKGAEAGIHPQFEQKFQVGNPVVFYGFTSTTTTAKVLNTFAGEAGSRTGFLLEVTHGAYEISEFCSYEEAEVLLEPFSTFIVSEVINFDDPDEKDKLALIRGMVPAISGLRLVVAKQTKTLLNMLNDPPLGMLSASPTTTSTSTLSTPMNPPHSTVKTLQFDRGNLNVQQQILPHTQLETLSIKKHLCW